MDSGTLKIFDIERFSIHDGRGIRTTVYLQGCPLRCPWCANPESQTIGQKLFYFKNKCVGCGSCSSVCLNKTLSYNNSEIVINRALCNLCGRCTQICPADALKISGEEKNIENILDIVMQDEKYYKNSGGGLTISGGEPFVQFEGLISLLREAKLLRLDTAVETCGQFSMEKLVLAEPFIDTFLFDIKHLDKALLQNVILADKTAIINNLGYLLDKSPQKVVIRVPIIPSFNNNIFFIKSLASYLEGRGLSELHLLQYHTLGRSKYSQLGMKYQFAPTEQVQESQMQRYKDILTSKGLRVKIGG